VCTCTTDVYNRGYGGYNTRWAKHIMPDLFPTHEANHTLITVFFGANDAADAGSQPRQHVPLDEYKANLHEMIAYLRTKAAKVRV
jgi:lysophospholipase L1-like esterase